MFTHGCPGEYLAIFVAIEGRDKAVREQWYPRTERTNDRNRRLARFDPTRNRKKGKSSQTSRVTSNIHEQLEQDIVS